MRDLKLKTSESGNPMISFSETVSGGEELAQKVVVNAGTEMGSDSIYGTERGSRLLKDCASGLLMSGGLIMKAAIIDASNIKNFVSKYNRSDDKLDSVSIDVDGDASYKNQTIAFKIDIKTTSSQFESILTV